MKWIRRRVLEGGTDPTVERRRLRCLCVDQEGADSSALRNCRRLKQSIMDQTLSEALALLGPIHAEPRQNNYRYRVSPEALGDPGRNIVVCDRSCGQCVVADNLLR